MHYAPIPICENGTPLYEITIADDLCHLPEAMSRLSLAGHLSLEGRKVFVIADSNVAPLYLSQTVQAFTPLCAQVDSFVLPAGEGHKNLDEVRKVYAYLIQHQCDRKDFLVALGGGVTGDLTGFTAATYLRGISFIQMPTTVLAMADSSIGGKTGVDFDAYKNMVGAFHQPAAVYMNVSFLRSLPERQYLSGFSEIIKHGLLEDYPLYVWMKENRGALLAKNPEVIAHMIYESCQDKRRIVEQDPKEQGVRALLNLGHTLGHAIEKEMNFTLLHGECVAIGTVAAAYLSFRRGMISEADYQDVRAMFQQFRQPISVNGVSPEAILRASKSDKKMEQGQIKFILLKRLGEAVMCTDVTTEELMDAIHSVVRTQE